ncbi:MAG: acetyl-CoA carboxylase biotin carboxyl carrier protein [Alphaproteobacteria bacterium]|nr:acetyl-CoA carboxylase biotin carboxyl carrier protein [Alphaproteobacteria bacterium]
MSQQGKKKEEERAEDMGMKIDQDAVRRLAELLDETGLTEIEIAEGDRRVRVVKSVTVAPAAVAAPAVAPVAAAAPAAVDETPVDAVTSPMVGTAYLSPQPGAAPFVTKGASVQAGDTLMIIEAMKVMNPIKADKGGTVQDILVSDAQPVEFGQPLVVIS